MHDQLGHFPLPLMAKYMVPMILKPFFSNRNNLVQVTDHMTPTLKQGGMKCAGPLNCIELGRSFHL